jgi:ketosteroid isomerase-like protein
MNDGICLRQLVEDWATAIGAKDVDRAMSYYAPEVVSFDLTPPLQYTGADAIRQGLAQWCSTWVGPIGHEIRDLTITVGGDVAFSRSLNHMTGKRTDGTETDVWVRATVGFREVGGGWRIVHEHASVPLYMDGSERAALDLKPE